MLLLIISIAICSLILTICIIQSIQMRRKSNFVLGVQIHEPVINSHTNRMISTNIN